MFKGLPFKHLPTKFKKLSTKMPTYARLGSKIALGIFLLAFLSSYQPVFGFPPFKKNIVKAQSEQLYQVQGQALPFEVQLPHPGYLSTKFSSYHPGVDIATGLGMPVRSIAKGVVIDQGYNFWGLGLTVTVEHSNGYRSIYAHLGQIYTKKGQSVDINDYLGTVGLTGNTSGPHTHLEITKDNQNINPLAVLPTIRDYPLEQDFITISTPSAKIAHQPNIEKTSSKSNNEDKAIKITPTANLELPKKVNIESNSLNHSLIDILPQSKPSL